MAAEAVAFEEAVRLYRQALAAGGRGDRRGRPEPARAGPGAALHRGGDLPGAQETAVRVGRRAERRRDRLGLARTALVMEASGVPEWDGEICRVCEQALAGDDLPDDLRARVSARYAQALVYRGEYDRAGPVSRDALAAAEAAGDPVALVDALRARQLACSPPRAWPSGSCWRAGCSRPPTPSAAPGSRCGAGCGGSTPCSRPVSCGTSARAHRPRLLPGPAQRHGRTMASTRVRGHARAGHRALRRGGPAGPRGVQGVQRHGTPGARSVPSR